MPLRSIVLADADRPARLRLRRVLERDARLEVVGEAGCGHQALNKVDIHEPSLVLMDVELPGLTGFHVAKALRRRRPRPSVILLSAEADDERQVAAIKAGAAGLLGKDSDPESILGAVHAVLRGQTLVSSIELSNPVLAVQLLDGVRRSGGRRGEADELAALSLRELAVLDCLVMGYSNREIAEALFIAEQTVKNHVSSLLRKLQLPGRMAALRYALSRGWAQIGPQPFAWTPTADGSPIEAAT